MLFRSVDIRIFEGCGDNFGDELVKGELDLAIGYFPQPLPGVELLDLYQEEVVLLISRQLLEDLYGPERQRVTEEVRSRQSLDPLKGCPFVVNSEEDVVGSLRQALFAQLDVEPSVRVMSKNLGMLLDLCLRGVGACFCPENMALATLTQEQLDSVERFRFSHGARFPIRIGCRRQARRWSLLSDFVDLTQQMLGEEEYQP